MPIKDIRSDLKVLNAFNATISSNTTTNGVIIDTADYDMGIMFTLTAAAYTDGTYTPLIRESDASDMSGANDVADDNLIGTEAGAVINALNTPKTIGIVGTKRYVRVSIVSTGVTTGAHIVGLSVMKPEILPVVQ